MAYTKTTWANGTAPAINAANLQNIEDALADVNATAAARTILDIDADTVSGYGIGVEVPDMGSTFAAAILSGNYKYGASTTSAPTTAAGTVIVVAGSVTDEFYAHDNSTYKMYHGYRAHGTSAPTWELVWTPASDGNGGQPPAPKPYLADNNKAGTKIVQDITSGSPVTTPNYAGSWYWEVYTYGATIGVGAATNGISAHNTGLGNASANLRVVHYKIT